MDTNAKSTVRHQRMIARRHKWADFREERCPENFYLGFNPLINPTQVYEHERTVRISGYGQYDPKVRRLIPWIY